LSLERFLFSENGLTMATRHSADRYAALWRSISQESGNSGNHIFAGEPHAGKYEQMAVESLSQNGEGIQKWSFPTLWAKNASSIAAM
jgi:hypothetical protein